MATPLGIQSILQGGYQHPLTRSLQAERQLTKNMLMYPIFISDNADSEEDISALPGQKRWGVNKLQGFLAPLVEKGLKSVILFGVPLTMPKDARGSVADSHAGPVIQGIKLIRDKFPDLFVACDVCLCEYTDHGHCGLINPDKTINQRPSVQRIAEVGLHYALAGAHCVAPSDMMDGRCKAIKELLLANNLANKCTVMSYSAKFASALYGPFREAAGSVPGFGDRKCYQLPPGARKLARRAMARDADEGADIIMVKPALPYLDVLAEARDSVTPNHPLACYQVSGEYAMVVAGANAGVYDLQAMALETHESMLRAGATLILSYFTPQFLDWLAQ